MIKVLISICIRVAELRTGNAGTLAARLLNTGHSPRLAYKFVSETLLNPANLGSPFYKI
jgi:hypothetical protein